MNATPSSTMERGGRFVGARELLKELLERRKVVDRLRLVKAKHLNAGLRVSDLWKSGHAEAQSLLESYTKLFSKTLKELGAQIPSV